MAILRARSRTLDFKRSLRHQRVDERAAKRLGSATQRLELYRAVGLRRFKGVDALRADFQPFGKLDARHTKRIPDRPDPAFRRRHGLFFAFERQEAFIEPLAGSLPDFFFHITT